MTEHASDQSFAEFLASYQPETPEDYDRHQENLKHIADARQHFAEATAPMVADLRAHGYDVERIDDLDNPGVGDAGAVPILLQHLPGLRDVSIIMALTAPLVSKWARPEARPRVVELYPTLTDEQDPEGQIRFYLGEVLERIADDSIAEQMIDIARDTRYGARRVLVVEGLARLKASRERAVPVLLELLDDPDAQVSAAVALGKLRVAAARPGIERLAQDPDSWVRDKARRALAKLPEN